MAERKVQRKEERRAKWLKEREEEEERKREEEQKLLEEEARKKQEEVCVHVRERYVCMFLFLTSHMHIQRYMLGMCLVFGDPVAHSITFCHSSVR